MEYSANINGINVSAYYSDENVREVFIPLLEGNYLLLDLDGWKELSDYADYTISLSADEGLLRERLVRRRIATGVEKKAAEALVDFSDMANVRLQCH